jgi:monovalent cation/proton antiporter MnhG/PhaG subunit
VSVGAVVADVLLGMAVLLVLACSLGVLVMRDVYQRLHFVGPISMVAPVLVGLAVSVRSGWLANTGETWLALAFVLVASPYLSHATIRAARPRERGDWRSLDSPRDRRERR